MYEKLGQACIKYSDNFVLLQIVTNVTNWGSSVITNWGKYHSIL